MTSQPLDGIKVHSTVAKSISYRRLPRCRPSPGGRVGSIRAVARLDEAALGLERARSARASCSRHFGESGPTRGKALDQALVDRLALAIPFAAVNAAAHGCSGRSGRAGGSTSAAVRPARADRACPRARASRLSDGRIALIASIWACAGAGRRVAPCRYRNSNRSTICRSANRSTARGGATALPTAARDDHRDNGGLKTARRGSRTSRCGRTKPMTTVATQISRRPPPAAPRATRPRPRVQPLALTPGRLHAKGRRARRADGSRGRTARLPVRPFRVTSVTSPRSVSAATAALQPALVHTFGARDVALRLLDLLAERLDRLLHVAERLKLELVDLVHRVIDVLEGPLQRFQRDRRRRGLLVDRARLGPQHLARVNQSFPPSWC